MKTLGEALPERLNSSRHEQYNRTDKQQVTVALAVTRDQQHNTNDEERSNDINPKASRLWDQRLS
jgi:hypothetical protein